MRRVPMRQFAELLKTGDLIVFSRRTKLSWLKRLMRRRVVSDIGFVYLEPTFSHMGIICQGGRKCLLETLRHFEGKCIWIRLTEEARSKVDMPSLYTFLLNWRGREEEMAVHALQACGLLEEIPNGLKLDDLPELDIFVGEDIEVVVPGGDL